VIPIEHFWVTEVGEGAVVVIGGMTGVVVVLKAIVLVEDAIDEGTPVEVVVEDTVAEDVLLEDDTGGPTLHMLPMPSLSVSS
jgi:hypothetical protein